eukprot:3067262-Alexandrium_andersonii.AAC.1
MCVSSTSGCVHRCIAHPCRQPLRARRSERLWPTTARLLLRVALAGVVERWACRTTPASLGHVISARKEQ